MTRAGWMKRQQQDVITYIREKNRILKNKLKSKRIRFTDDERVNRVLFGSSWDPHGGPHGHRGGTAATYDVTPL